MADAPHERVNSLAIAGLGGKSQQPFPKGCVQGLALRTGNRACLFDQVFIGAEGNIFFIRVQGIRRQHKSRSLAALVMTREMLVTPLTSLSALILIDSSVNFEK